MTKLNTLISTVVLDEAYFDMTSNYYVLYVLLKSLKKQVECVLEYFKQMRRTPYGFYDSHSHSCNIDPKLLASNPILRLKSACST